MIVRVDSMRYPTARSRRFGAAVPLLVTALLLVPVPAAAHPFIAGGGQVPVRSLATITLDLAHGCGDERTGTGDDTDEVALDAPSWLRVVGVPPRDGWDVTIEDGDREGSRTVIWSATTGAEPAPRFTLDVVVEGEEGETRFLRVSQRCGDRIERWVGTPDEPAEQPGIRLRLTAADPTSPPPPPAPPADAADAAETIDAAPSPVAESETAAADAGGAVDPDASATGPTPSPSAPAAVVIVLALVLGAIVARRSWRRRAGTIALDRA